MLRFLREASRLDRGDLAWFLRFPGYLVSPSRWPLRRHRGHFDPGQRLMAWALVLTLTAVVVSGVLMIVAVEVLGPRYGLVLRTHTVASVALGALVVAHVGVSLGLPKGYRGVWRAMHAPGGGAVSERLARALWPEWAEEQQTPGDPAE